MLLTDDRLVDTMRDYVMATNRLQYLSQKEHVDLIQVEQASEAHREATLAFQHALVSRGWRHPAL